MLLVITTIDRYLLNGALGFHWVEELCVIIMVWLIFLSVFTIDREDLHLKVTLFTFKPTWTEWLEDLCMSALALFLLWTTVSILPVLFRTYAALGWSIKVGYYALIVGSVLVLLNKILKYVLRIVGR